MNRPPTVSVVITVFDHAPYLAEAIESVLEQTYAPIELVVVDDASGDDSGYIADGYSSRATVLHRATRGGIGAARNMGVAATTGSLMAFLDADDRYPPERTEGMAARLAAEAEIDAAFGQVTEFVSPELSEQQVAGLRPPLDRIAGRLAPAMLVRREAFDRVGPFSETLRVGVGLDWFARARDQGMRAVVLDDVVYQRRLHPSSNGLREADRREQYAAVLKASIDRRRRG